MRPGLQAGIAAALLALAGQGFADEVFVDPPEWNPQDKAPATPKAAREFFVGPRGDDAAKGTKAAPWKTLQASLCRLEPGDHLFVLAGQYPSPVSIAKPCKDGASKRPIQVTAEKDAVVMGSEGKEPVVRIARSHWRIRGLEIIGDWAQGPALLIEAPARDIEFAEGHIHNGVGTGVVVDKGAKDITIRRSHIHHIAEPRGGPNRRAAANVAGIAVRDGAGPVSLIANNVHSIAGVPLDLAKAAKVTLSANEIQDNPPPAP